MRTETLTVCVCVRVSVCPCLKSGRSSVCVNICVCICVFQCQEQGQLQECVSAVRVCLARLDYVIKVHTTTTTTSLPLHLPSLHLLYLLSITLHLLSSSSLSPPLVSYTCFHSLYHPFLAPDLFFAKLVL